MAQPSRQQVEFALDRCMQSGVVREWQARPLGIYRVSEWDGDVYTFDRKEAILWAQGIIFGLNYIYTLMASGEDVPLPPHSS